MRYLYGKYGCTSPNIKEYKISTQSDLAKGTIMAVCENGVIAPMDEQTTMVAGILANNYEANENILNPESGKGYAKINLSEGIYSICAPVFVSKGGSASTLVVSDEKMALVSASEFIGGKLVLKAKSKESTNTDELLSERTIIGFSVSGTDCTFTLSEGSAPCADDEYVFYPKLGFSALGYTDDTQNFGVCKNGLARVIANDEKNAQCHIVLTNALCK